MSRDALSSMSGMKYREWLSSRRPVIDERRCRVCGHLSVARPARRPVNWIAVVLLAASLGYIGLDTLVDGSLGRRIAQAVQSVEIHASRGHAPHTAHRS